MLRLRAGHEMRRGFFAKTGFVAWNQPAEDESLYNTVRPFFGVHFALEENVYFDPAGDSRYLPMLRWIEDVEAKADWREVAEERLLELEWFAERFKCFARWHLGVPEGETSIRPTGDDEPSARGATTFVVAASTIYKCTTVARRRIEETKTLKVRRDLERRALTGALDSAEAEKSVAEWKLKSSESSVPSAREKTG